jgi:NAD(P)-dependent dehydrogenase (short-subunit alcohol dehydrogenase family)
LLTNLLLNRLKAAREARVVNVNSDAHEQGIIDFDDIHMRRHYPSGGVGMRAYGNAKLANLLTTYELARRLRDSGVVVNALHPGYVATNILPLDRASGPVRLLKPLWHIAKHAILTAEQGAATPVYLASSPEMRDVSGFYFEKCVPVASSAASRDRNLQARMWAISEQLTRNLEIRERNSQDTPRMHNRRRCGRKRRLRGWRGGSIRAAINLYRANGALWHYRHLPERQTEKRR